MMLHFGGAVVFRDVRSEDPHDNNDFMTDDGVP